MENSARGAALSTGCEVEVTVHPGLKSNIRNRPLEKLFVHIFKELCEEVEDPVATAAKPPGASTDFAAVTHVVPGIHPMIAIAPEGVAIHSQEFVEATFTDSGHRGLEIGAKALAAAAVEILADAELLADIKEA